ncbi:hypothetical protein F4778DRAFT_778486 [Xylariomycetidae sp. FL2044]|nr:hypothetical protein F4778DRAFT_778486 [Xylariomycetidae sp. FL2044]
MQVITTIILAFLLSLAAEASRRTPRTAAAGELGSPADPTTQAPPETTITVAPHVLGEFQTTTTTTTTEARADEGADQEQQEKEEDASPTVAFVTTDDDDENGDTTTTATVATAAAAAAMMVTEAPGSAPDLGEYADEYTQVTYFSCHTFALETHCGWHEPIVRVNNAAGRGVGKGGKVVRAGLVAAGVVGGFLLGVW